MILLSSDSIRCEAALSRRLRLAWITLGLCALLGLAGCGGAQPTPDSAKSPDLQFDLAELFISSGAYDAATPIVTALRREHPEDPRASTLMGIILREKGVYAEAERLFVDALQRDVDYAPAHDALGILYGVQNFGDRAVKAHRRATELAPENAKYWHNLGFALSLCRQFDDAVKAYQTSLRLAPDQQRTFINLALLHASRGRDEEALRLLKQTLTPTKAWFNLALVQERRGDLISARVSLDEALRLTPHHKEAKQLLDRVRLKLASQPSHQLKEAPNPQKIDHAQAEGGGSDPQTVESGHAQDAKKLGEQGGGQPQPQSSSLPVSSSD